MSDAYRGTMDPADAGSDFNVMRFIAKQIMNGMWTATLVKVKAVTGGDGALALAGTVDVQPMVNQLDGSGNKVEHGIIYGIPYMRMQGGVNAVIMDPEEDDIGLAIFASHDISSVIANQDVANPGSRRRFDPADAMYLGGFLNAVPTRYVQFSDSGLTLVDPTQITLQAPSITLDGDVEVTGDLTGDGAGAFDNEVSANNSGTAVHLSTHHHTGVTTGSGSTGGPVG